MEVEALDTYFQAFFAVSYCIHTFVPFFAFDLGAAVVFEKLESIVDKWHFRHF